MQKTLIFSLGLCLALSSCGWVEKIFKKIEVETSVSKEETADGGKKESVAVKLSFTLSSAGQGPHKKVSEREVTVTGFK